MSKPPPIPRPFGAFLVAIVCTACADSGTGPDPGEPDVSVTGVNVTATPNPADVTVTVQASAEVTPAGAPQSVTWSSSDETLATVDASGLVTLLRHGTVVITATSTANPTRSGQITLTITCPEPRRVSANLGDDTTWENWVPDPGCFDYVVETDLSLNSQLLTVEAGTVVGFEEGRGLRVRGDAGLHAEGTEAEPIRFTGTTMERGFWWGIAVENTDHPDNLMAYTTVEYGGGEGVTINGVEPANLRLVDQAILPIANSTFRQSAAYGLAIDYQAVVGDPDGNVLTENALGPAWVWGTEVPDLNGASLTGNDVDEVVVRPNAIDGDAAWPGAVYHVLYHTQQAFTVNSGVLTLRPGAELRFEGDQSMLITAEAGLSASGTAEAPIVITGASAEPGSWGGLGIIGSDNAANRLDHVVVEYGGGLSIGGTSERASLVLTHSGDPTRIAISNTTLRRSEGYGLYARAGTALDGFEDNTLTENTAGPAYVGASVVDDLSASNTFTGNAADEIAVQTGTGMTLMEAATWRDLGVPFFLTNQGSLETAVFAPLTIEAGVEMLFAPGVGMTIQEGGSLVAEGTSDDHISMRAKSSAWKGLEFLNTTGSLDYLDIEDAGSTKWGQVDQAGGITIVASGVDVSAVVQITGNVDVTGSDYAIVFSHGNSIATGCPGPTYIPPPDEVSDHCRPPTGAALPPGGR